MKKIILLNVLILAGFSLLGQKITLSEKESLNYRNDDFMVIGKYLNYSAIYTNNSSGAEIIFYNRKFLKEKTVSIPFLKNVNYGVYFSNSANDLVIYYTSRENKKTNLYAARLKEDFTWFEPVLLKNSPASSFRANNYFKYCSSDDQSKTMIYNSYSENNFTWVETVVYDQKLTKISEARQSFSEEDFFISDIAAVSNRGECFIVSSDDRNFNTNAEQLNLLSIKPGDSSFAITPFILDNHAVSDLHLILDNYHSNAYLCGYFSNGKNNTPRGIYYCSINFETLKFNGNYFTPLTLQITSSPTDLRYLKIKHVFLRKTGEIEIVCEKIYQTTRNLSNNNPLLSSSYMMSSINEASRTVNEFSYDEIVIFSMRIDGSMAWTQNILKEQTTIDDNGVFSSYCVLQHKLGHAYIFNDLSQKQSRLLAAYISGNGEMTVKELQTSEEAENWNLMPASGMQTSASEIIIPCVSKNYLCFLRISY